MPRGRKSDKPAGSSNEPRIFHYTVSECYEAIVRDGVIRPATERVPPGERPAVWFSINPMWEPTATDALRDENSGQVQLLTWEEMQQYGLVRIEVGPNSAPHRWKDYLRLSGASAATARGLERVAKSWHANVFHWRVSFHPVPTEEWLAVEQWSGTRWEPIHQTR